MPKEVRTLVEERVGEIVILRPPMPFWLGAEETDEFTGRVRDLAAAGCTRLVVNLASIPRMNSISVGALGEAWNALRPNQGRLIVCCAGKECLLILKLTRLDEVITVCASEAEALALLAPSQAP